MHRGYSNSPLQVLENLTFIQQLRVLALNLLDFNRHVIVGLNVLRQIYRSEATHTDLGAQLVATAYSQFNYTHLIQINAHTY